MLTGGRGTSAAPYGYSPSELDWDKGKLSLARDICMGFGVPPMLVGIPGEATFANYREARESFWEDTVKWYLELLKAELNGWLFPDTSKDKLFLDYDMDVVPAMAYKRDKLWDRAIAAGDFLTVDERREMVGQPKYEPGDTPGGVIMTDSTKIPLGTEIDTTEMDLETGPKPPPAPKPVKPAEKPTKKEDSTEYMEG